MSEPTVEERLLFMECESRLRKLESTVEERLLCLECESRLRKLENAALRKKLNSYSRVMSALVRAVGTSLTKEAMESISREFVANQAKLLVDMQSMAIEQVKEDEQRIDAELTELVERTNALVAFFDENGFPERK